MALYEATAELSRSTHSSGHIEVTVPYRASDLIKQLPGARWDAKRHVWRMPLTVNACVQLRGAMGEALTVGPELTAWSHGEWARRESVILLRVRAQDPANDAPGTAGLRPYQRTAVAFLREAESAVLGDEQGTGKSVMLADLAQRLDKWPVLVVCPRGVQYTWLDAANRWAPGRHHVVLEGSATQRRKTLEAFAQDEQRGVLIATYTQLPMHSRLAPYGSVRLAPAEKEPKELNTLGFRVVIADEAHRAVHAKTKWTRALWAVGDVAEHRYAATGTVTLNDVGDFWALLRFVAPAEWPSYSKFLDQYCRVSLNYWGGHEIVGLNPAKADEFHELVSTRFLRRSKALVLPFLPQKQRVTRTVDLPPKLRTAYRQMEKGMVSELSGHTIEAFDPLTKWLRMSQFASGAMEGTGEFEEWTDRETGEVFMREVYRMVEPSPKLDELEEILSDYAGQPLAVFAASRQLLDLAAARLDKRGVTYAKVVGGMHPYAIHEAKTDFNAGRVSVLLVSLGAGAEGLSLTGDLVEVFLDRSWSEAVNAQAEDRGHGIGRGDQDAEHLTIIDIVARDTVEERRLEALKGKADQREEINRDGALLRRVFGGA